MSYEEGGWDRPAVRDPRAPGARPGQQRPANLGRGYPERSYRGPDYPGPAYPERGNPGPAYPERGNPGRGNPGPAYPERGNPGRGNPGPGYRERGYPDSRYQERGYPGPDYRGPAYQQQGPRPVPEPVSRLGGATGNERLTAMTGAVLLVLLLAEGFTILRIGRLITVHVFLGMLLIGPVTLKAGSTIYRFCRYYTGHPDYRRKGPPAPLLRLLGPLVVLLTACVLGSGVMLAFIGPAGRNPWLLLHKASFILWFCVMAVHVLAYAPRLPRLLAREARGTGDPEDGRYAGVGRRANQAAAVLGGRGVRLTLLIAALVCGLVIALLTVHLAGQWQAAGRY